ncbi:hypothetical protein I317_00273 [Kwoniella heveanensis CBS 569]|nr:hypothetical protein I317_00273 [Kwoniella heveanensis CBS 569]
MSTTANTSQPLPLPQLTTTPPPADAPRRRFGSFNNIKPAAPPSPPPLVTQTQSSQSYAFARHRQRPSSSSSTTSLTSITTPTASQTALIPPAPQPQRTRSASSASSTVSATHNNAQPLSQPLAPPLSPNQVQAQAQAQSQSQGPGGFDITFAADKAQQWLSTWAPRGEGRGREFLNNTLNNVASVASTVSHNLNRDGFVMGGGSGSGASGRSNSFVSTTSTAPLSVSGMGGGGSSASPSTSPEEPYRMLGSSVSPPPILNHSNTTPILSSQQQTSSSSSSQASALMNSGRRIPQPANLARLGQSSSTTSAPSTSALSQTRTASTSAIGSGGGVGLMTNPSFGGSTTSLPSTMPRSSSGTLTPTTGLHGPSHLNPNASQTHPGQGHRRNSSTASSSTANATTNMVLSLSPNNANNASAAHRRSSSFGLSVTNPFAKTGRSPSISRSSSTTARSVTGTMKSAGMPYKIGFQPQGVRNDRTADYNEARRIKAEDREREEGRLGRRWAKLVDLHFNPTLPSPQPVVPTLTRSSSSTFSLSTLSNPDRRRSLLSIDGALDALKPKEVWKGLKGPTGPGGEEGRKRAAEQAIVKWEDDSEVKKCRICLSSFSLSNRKHHCRLCGRIICSLPPTPPALLAVQIQLFAPSDPSATSTATQGGLPPGTRRDKCSLLLVADWKTGRGEEVDEGFVGWMKMDDSEGIEDSASAVERGKGRRRGRTSTASILSTTSVISESAAEGGEKRDIPLPQQPKEVQVKGVRVCRECWGVVSRKQKMADRQRINGFARLYQALRMLQSEIEELMPEYEDQLAELTESSEAHDPTPEVIATHKSLLTLFAQYEHLSKRIGGLTCTEGSSQAVVQSAVARSAAGFLAKEMVKLQALQRIQKKAALAKRKSMNMNIKELTLSETMTPSSSNDGFDDGLGAGAGAGDDGDQGMVEDVAVMLQPLLEQEAQLESYIADANAQRKYEDSKALSEALRDIKSEIERITNSVSVGSKTRSHGA